MCKKGKQELQADGEVWLDIVVQVPEEAHRNGEVQDLQACGSGG